MIKSNLSSPARFQFSPKRNPGRRFWVTEITTFNYIHITNSEKKATVKIHFLFPLFYFKPLVKDIKRSIYSSQNSSFQTETTFKCLILHLSLWNGSNNHSSDHIQNWCLHQLTLTCDYQILWNIFLYLMTATVCKILCIAGQWMNT